MSNQRGAINSFPLLLILAITGIIAFLLFSSFAPSGGFRFNALNPKSESHAATTPSLYYQYTIGLGKNLSTELDVDSAVGVSTNGQKMAVADTGFQRVAIYNTIPTNDNAAPDVVVGQPDFFHQGANQGGSPGANTVHFWVDQGGVLLVGNKLIIADYSNNRVLIFNSIPTTNGASADVVIGQPDFTHITGNDGGMSATTMEGPWGLASDGTKLLVADSGNNRVLVYNTIPTSNNAAPNVVIGAPDFTHMASGVSANTLLEPAQMIIVGGKLIIADESNNRVLIYNSIPTTNNAPADVVIGQPDFTHNATNQGLISPAPNTLSSPTGLASDGTSLYIQDHNGRIQIFNPIPTTNNASAVGSFTASIKTQYDWQLAYQNGFVYAADWLNGVDVYATQPPQTPTPSPTADPTPSPTPTTNCSLESSGDLDCNGKIDIFDYNIMVANFGKHL